MKLNMILGMVFLLCSSALADTEEREIKDASKVFWYSFARKVSHCPSVISGSYCDTFEIDEMIESNEASPNKRNKEGKTLLMLAVENSAPISIIETLLSRKPNVNATDKNGDTALMLSTQLDISQLLLRKGARINSVNRKNGLSAILYAIKNGQQSIFIYLKNIGAKLDFEKAMKIAHEERTLKFAKLIMGAAPEHRKRRLKKLYEELEKAVETDFLVNALSSDEFESASKHLAKGADINAIIKYDDSDDLCVNCIKEPDKNLLMLAVDAKNADMLRWLIENGAEVNKVIINHWVGHPNGPDRPVYSKTRWTALLYASFSREHHEEQKTDVPIRMLVEAGAEIDFGSEHGWTALFELIHRCLFRTAAFLVENGAKINHRNNYGETPFILLAQEPNWSGNDAYIEEQKLQFAKYLVQAGANIKAKDGKGRSALYYAQKNNYEKLASFIRQELNRK